MLVLAVKYRHAIARFVPRHMYFVAYLYCFRWLGKRKEGNVLLNDALNTFYLRIYGVRHMVKDH